MSRPTGAKRAPERWVAWHLAPTAGKLTRRHRDVARADPAFAGALRRQTMYPQRIDALVEGCTWFAGKPCEKCGSVKRRVFDCGCWNCKRNARPWIPGRGWDYSSQKLSRAGREARAEERRREAAGEVQAFEVGDWRARVYPTGRLALDCDRLHIHSEDWGKVPPARIFEIGSREPDLVQVMRQAGWSV
ncbi:TPA: hypothetical protein QDA71_006385 [Burkholderia vietnamiensis]|nr:hypothetical protein [Burkholderia vietnamiensis]HDR9211138.1 hypothetical protein [Burkholderia vietnamiensis]